MVKNGLISHRGSTFFSSLILGACLAVNAFAGSLSTTTLAYNDGGGQDVSGRWQNSVALTTTTPVIFGTVEGTLEYAVFAPGDFQAFSDAEYGSGTYTIPEAAFNYIYAFQFLPTGGTVIESLNAGYANGVQPGIPMAIPGWLAGSGAKSPLASASFLNVTSALWGYGSGGGTSTDESDVVYYAHPNSPIPDQATLRGLAGLAQADSGPADFASPNPVPEPTGLLLAFVGAIGFASSRRYRR